MEGMNSPQEGRVLSGLIVTPLGEGEEIEQRSFRVIKAKVRQEVKVALKGG